MEHSLNENLATITSLADCIVSECAGLTGGMSAACTKYANGILQALERITPQLEEVVQYGMEKRKQDHDRVSGSGEELRNVRHKTDANRKNCESASRIIQTQKAARQRAAKAKRPRRKARK